MMQTTHLVLERKYGLGSKSLLTLDLTVGRLLLFTEPKSYSLRVKNVFPSAHWFDFKLALTTFSHLERNKSPKCIN